MSIINELRKITLEKGIKTSIEIFIDTFDKDTKEYQLAVKKSKAFEKHYQNLEYAISTKDFRFGRITRNSFDISLNILENIL